MASRTPIFDVRTIDTLGWEQLCRTHLVAVARADATLTWELKRVAVSVESERVEWQLVSYDGPDFVVRRRIGGGSLSVPAAARRAEVVILDDLRRAFE